MIPWSLLQSRERFCRVGTGLGSLSPIASPFSLFVRFIRARKYSDVGKSGNDNIHIHMKY